MIALILRHRFKLLLVCLLTLILIVPLVLGDVALHTEGVGRGLIFAFTICVLLTGSLAAGGKRHIKLFFLALVIPSVLVESATSFIWPGELAIANHGMRILFLGFIIVQLVQHLFDPEVVTFDTLCASMCVYLLVGLLWANVFVIIETLTPGSILTVVRSDTLQTGLIGEVERSSRMLYFSFTTITGVGYGDIVPMTQGARMLAVMEALVGQSYLLIMVSRLVGLHVSQTLAKTSSSG